VKPPLCQQAGLVKLGQVALDGTKVLANASKHKAMSYGRMGEAEQKLEREVAALLARTAQVDAAEDARYGKGQRGDALPAELARRESRLTKIREAKAALEAEARAQAAEVATRAQAKLAERQRQAETTGRKPTGRPACIPDPTQAKPKPKAQRNFTDPESRIMKDGATKSFVQAYNAQAAVDRTAQIIVAADVPPGGQRQAATGGNADPGGDATLCVRRSSSRSSARSRARAASGASRSAGSARCRRSGS